jgi:hypothetical protein
LEPARGFAADQFLVMVLGWQSAHGPFLFQVVQKLPQQRPGRNLQLLLQGAAVRGGSGVKEGVVGVAPSFQGRFGLAALQMEQQGRHVRLQLNLQLEALVLR